MAEDPEYAAKEKVKQQERNRKKTAERKAKREELTQKALNHQDYGDLTNKVKALMEEKQQTQIEKANCAAEMKRVQELVDLMEATPAEMTEYDEALTRQLIEKVTIYDDHMQFEFKAGITIDVER